MNRRFRRSAILITAPKRVIGYHGCSQEIAETILTENRFLVSTNTYDWLGEGAYFWEFAPHRALEWARERYEKNHFRPAVIGANILLGRCLNLLDTEHLPGLEDTYNVFVRTVGSNSLFRNTEAGAHFLDRYILDAYCRLIEEQGPTTFQTVRGCFPEGDAIYRGSKILKKAHVQIAVRDVACISHLHLVQFP